jgi:hypothetical protein
LILLPLLLLFLLLDRHQVTRQEAAQERVLGHIVRNKSEYIVLGLSGSALDRLSRSANHTQHRLLPEPPSNRR